MSAPEGYSRVQIALHWAVAVLVILQLIFGEGIGDAFDTLLDSGVARYDAVAIAHIVGGVAILLLVLWRLVLRSSRGVPDLPAGMSMTERRLAQGGHLALYALMLLAPLSGLVAWFGALEAAGDVHELVKPAFVLLIAAHVLAALWHQFVRRDGLMARMKRAED